jgi:hypothetical protein
MNAQGWSCKAVLFSLFSSPDRKWHSAEYHFVQIILEMHPVKE